jgi:hypothetical protein
MCFSPYAVTMYSRFSAGTKYVLFSADTLKILSAGVIAIKHASPDMITAPALHETVIPPFEADTSAVLSVIITVPVFASIVIPDSIVAGMLAIVISPVVVSIVIPELIDDWIPTIVTVPVSHSTDTPANTSAGIPEIVIPPVEQLIVKLLVTAALIPAMLISGVVPVAVTP